MSGSEDLIRRFQQQTKRKPKDDQERMQQQQASASERYIQELDERFTAIAQEER